MHRPYATRLWLVCLLLFLAAWLPCCTTTPPDPPDPPTSARDDAKALTARSGDASARRSETTPFSAAGGSQLGDVTNYQAQLKTSREEQGSNTGPVQFAFQAQADMDDVVHAVRTAVEEDGGVQMLKSSIEVVFPIWRDVLGRAHDSTGEEQAALEAQATRLATQLEDLRGRLIERTHDVVTVWTKTATAAADAAKLDLSSVTNLNVVTWNWNQGTGIGRDHKPLTDYESRALAAAAVANSRVGIAVAGKPGEELPDEPDELPEPPEEPDGG